MTIMCFITWMPMVRLFWLSILMSGKRCWRKVSSPWRWLRVRMKHRLWKLLLIVRWKVAVSLQGRLVVATRLLQSCPVNFLSEVKCVRWNRWWLLSSGEFNIFILVRTQDWQRWKICRIRSSWWSESIPLCWDRYCISRLMTVWIMLSIIWQNWELTTWLR